MQYSDLSIQVGDVIYVEANSGAVKRQGRSDTFATEFDLEAEEYVPLPKVEYLTVEYLVITLLYQGDVHKRKEVIQDVTLHLGGAPEQGGLGSSRG